jgi:phage tail protein X
MAIYDNSRYIDTVAYMKDGETLTLAKRNRAKFTESDATYYTVILGDTLDGIAYKQYGYSNLGWAILDANPKYQSELDIKIGDVILIPKFEEVVTYIE